MKHVHDGLCVKNMSHLALKEIYALQIKKKEKSLTDNEIKKHKMTEGEFFKKCDNLTENELNSENNKIVFVRNDVMTTVIVLCNGEKRGQKKNRGEFRRKLVCTEHDIMMFSEYSVNSKILCIRKNT